jgi:hypothetical protein
MELNHIVSVAQGGQWTFENSIPLCFDCHAEVGHYNVEHPKGLKFTPKELREHRDRWFRKIQQSGASVAMEAHLALDRTLFRKIAGVMPSDGSMLHLAEFNIESLFDFDLIAQDFWKFQDLCRKPDVEFMDADLEGLGSGILM